MKKIIILLLLLITGISVIQMPSLQKKLISYLLKESPTKIRFKESSGFFPLAVTFTDLSIETDSFSLFAEKAACKFPPIPFLFKTLTLLDLEATGITFVQKEKFESKPLPIALKIHHFTIKNFFYKDQTLDCEGNFFLEKNGEFSLSAKGEYLNVDWTLFAEKEFEKIAISGKLLYEPFHGQFLFSGLGAFDDFFAGQLYAKAELNATKLALLSSWKCSASQLTLPDLKLLLNNATLQASLRYDLEDAKLGIFGKVMQEPFILQTVLHKKENAFSLSPAILHFLDNEISLSFLWTKDDFNLSLCGKFAQIERTEEFFSHLFDYHKPLKGDLYLDLVMQKKAAKFSANVQDFQFQNYSIPKGLIKGYWKKDSPLSLNFSVQQFTINDPFFEICPPLNLSADMQLTETQINLKGKIEGLGDESFFINCDLPLVFSLRPFHFSLNYDAPFTASFSGKGCIDPLLSFLENYNLVIQGNVDCEFNLCGTLNDPLSHGHLAFKGSLQEVTTSIFLEDVEALILAENKEITISKLFAQEKTKGRVEILGKALLEKNIPISLQIMGKSLPLFGFEPLFAETDFLIYVEGTIDHLEAKGNAVLSDAEYRLQKNLTTKIPQMTLCYLQPKEIPQEKHSLLPLHLDVDVTIPSNLLIKGNGFDSQWSGELNIQGTIQAPICKGRLHMQKGRLDFARHIFYLTEGEIIIEEPNPKNIHLNIRGETDAIDIVVFFQASGTVEATEITFTSSPPLSTQAIFSKLLFDSDLNELTPFQACRLARFLIGLSSMNSSISKFQSIKESLGIDVFDITHCDFDTYDFTFQVGKYISQGTYVGINKSISGNFDEVEIQTRLFREFYLEGNFGGSLNGLTPNGGKIIFKWYRSY